MIISRTPYRISFFGGGSDFPEWFLDHGGKVMSTTIDKYCYVSVRKLPPFFGIKHRVVWSHIESVNTIGEILHPAVREGLRYLGWTDQMEGLEIHHQGDLPARAGMGSSSAFVVGLFRVMAQLSPFPCGEALHDNLAMTAIKFEREVLKESVGWQDQFAVSHGGFNVIEFSMDESALVRCVLSRRLEMLNDNLMLFYLNSSRCSTVLAKRTVDNVGRNEKLLYRMVDLVDEAESLLKSDRDLDAFGGLLNETWHLKRQLAYGISSELVDKVYSDAIGDGAWGGKLLGAGQTGFMLFYVPLDRQEAVKQVLNKFVHVPFRFENEGSVIIHQ